MDVIGKNNVQRENRKEERVDRARQKRHWHTDTHRDTCQLRWKYTRSGKTEACRGRDLGEGEISISLLSVLRICNTWVIIFIGKYKGKRRACTGVLQEHLRDKTNRWYKQKSPPFLAPWPQEFSPIPRSPVRSAFFHCRFRSRLSCFFFSIMNESAVLQGQSLFSVKRGGNDIPKEAKAGASWVVQRPGPWASTQGHRLQPWPGSQDPAWLRVAATKTGRQAVGGAQKTANGTPLQGS